MARQLLLGVFPTKQAAQQALGASPTASQSSVVLPQGKELSNSQLENTDGEGFFSWLISTAVGAGLGAIIGPAYYAVNNAIHHKPVTWAGAKQAAKDGAITGAIGGAIGYFIPLP
jgi:hypothetical protein